jgi:polyferredoxin
VDIRNGLDMGCIQCGLCIDACDNVMTRIGRPKGLIGYDTDLNVERRAQGLPALKPKILRARTVAYMVLILGVAAVMGFSLATRHTLGVDVMHDRNPIYVALSDGSLRNGYAIRALNKTGSARDFKLTLDGLPRGQLEILGQKSTGALDVHVEADQTLELRVMVTTPPDATPPQSTPIKFVLTDPKTGEQASRADFFKGP